MNQATLNSFREEPGSRSGAPRGGEAKAGATNVVRAFAKPNARLIYTICDIRRDRGKFMPGKLFREPAWDILLELYAAQLDNQRMSITRLNRRSGITATTVLRCLGALETVGLVRRSEDPMDLRRVFVSLTLAGEEAMDGYFAESGARSVFL